MKVTTMLLALSFLVSDIILVPSRVAAQNQHVFAVGASSSLVESVFENGSWIGQNTFNGGYIAPEGKSFTTFTAGSTMYAAYYDFDSDGIGGTYSLHVMATTGNTANAAWTITELGNSQGFHDGDRNSGLIGFSDSSGTPRIFYVDSTNERVSEVYVSSGVWHIDNGVQGTGAPVVSNTLGTSLLGYVFNSHVAAWYVATDEHIHKIWQDSAGWHTDDVTIESGGPPVLASSPLVGYTWSSAAIVWYLSASNGHIYKSWWTGSAWFSNDVTAGASAPQPEFGTPLMGYVFNNQPAIWYIALDGDIHKIWWTGSWHQNNVTTDSGQPSPLSNSQLTGYSFGGNATVFYFSNDQPESDQAWEAYWNGTRWQGNSIGLIVNMSSGANLASVIF